MTLRVLSSIGAFMFIVTFACCVADPRPTVVDIEQYTISSTTTNTIVPLQFDLLSHFGAEVMQPGNFVRGTFTAFVRFDVTLPPGNVGNFSLFPVEMPPCNDNNARDQASYTVGYTTSGSMLYTLFPCIDTAGETPRTAFLKARYIVPTVPSGSWNTTLIVEWIFNPYNGVELTPGAQETSLSVTKSHGNRLPAFVTLSPLRFDTPTTQGALVINMTVPKGEDWPFYTASAHIYSKTNDVGSVAGPPELITASAPSGSFWQIRLDSTAVSKDMSPLVLVMQLIPGISTHKSMTIRAGFETNSCPRKCPTISGAQCSYTGGCRCADSNEVMKFEGGNLVCAAPPTPTPTPTATPTATPKPGLRPGTGDPNTTIDVLSVLLALISTGCVGLAVALFRMRRTASQNGHVRINSYNALEE